MEILRSPPLLWSAKTAPDLNAFLSYRVHKQTNRQTDKQINKQTDNEIYHRRSTGLANRSAKYFHSLRRPSKGSSLWTLKTIVWRRKFVPYKPSWLLRSKTKRCCVWLVFTISNVVYFYHCRKLTKILGLVLIGRSWQTAVLRMKFPQLMKSQILQSCHCRLLVSDVSISIFYVYVSVIYCA